MEEVKCPACGRKDFRFLVRKHKFCCIRCGEEWDKVEVKDE